MSYARATTATADRHLEILDRAYRLAGVTIPNRTTATLAAIKNQPTAATVAEQIAAEAFTTTNDDDGFLEDALVRIGRALAADEMRAGVARVLPRQAQIALPGLVDRAAADLAPAFARAVKALVKASAKLDPDAPLNHDRAFRDDTTAELKAAETVLGEIGQYASIHPQTAGHNVPAALTSVLAVVALPETVVETVRPTFGSGATTNVASLGGTLTVRKVQSDLEGLGTDQVLVKVAQGAYEGATLALADTAGHRARLASAGRAFVTVTAQPGEGGVLQLR